MLWRLSFNWTFQFVALHCICWAKKKRRKKIYLNYTDVVRFSPLKWVIYESSPILLKWLIKWIATMKMIKWCHRLLIIHFSVRVSPTLALRFAASPRLPNWRPEQTKSYSVATEKAQGKPKWKHFVRYGINIQLKRNEMRIHFPIRESIRQATRK